MPTTPPRPSGSAPSGLLTARYPGLTRRHPPPIHAHSWTWPSRERVGRVRQEEAKRGRRRGDAAVCKPPYAEEGSVNSGEHKL
eukprot:749351-Hanusia_phi.AAC.10